jgi:hypothetical protein
MEVNYSTWVPGFLPRRFLYPQATLFDANMQPHGMLKSEDSPAYDRILYMSKSQREWSE